jgi:acyl-CoA thioester hydrolase
MIYPKLEQLRELPVQLSMPIPPEWEDRNGHVNVQFYLALYELGGWVVLEEIGVDEDWFKRHQVSQFDLEHHLNYRAELKVGDQVSTYSRVLGRSEKRFHGMYFIVNETSRRLAATLEYVTASVDMKTRRTAPFLPELASGLDLLIEKHRALDWAAPESGTMKP